MKSRILLKLLFLLGFTMGSGMLVADAQPVMPCCADLACEDNYQGCMYACSYFHPGSQSCMDTCASEAHDCQISWCSDCNSHIPCWWDPYNWEAACGIPNSTTIGNDACYEAHGCAYPAVCMAGHCVTGGCGVSTSCTGQGYSCGNNVFSGQTCSGGFCINNPCP